MMEQKSALIIGASGLIGAEVLKLCLASDMYHKVIAPVRSSLGIDHDKLDERIIDFDNPLIEELFPVDHVYCCLGTTIKVAGSQANFRQVDYAYPLAFAKAAKAWNASVYSVVTAAGANANSRIFYNRVKGELESALQALDLKTTLVFQPSLLLGQRSEFRLGEKIAIYFAKLTAKITPSSFRAIHSKQVAKCMLKETCSAATGYNIINNKTMHKAS